MDRIAEVGHPAAHRRTVTRRGSRRNPRLSARGAQRSTARASSTREDTPSLRKMLRRCVSTVFWLRNSSAAISGLVLRSTTSPATCSSRSVSAASPSAPAAPGRVRRCTRFPRRRSSCSAASRCGRAPHASKVAAARSISADGAVRLAGRRERPPGEHPRQRGLDHGADLLGGRRGRQRPFGGCAVLAGVQGDRRGGALGPGDRPSGGRGRPRALRRPPPPARPRRRGRGPRRRSPRRRGPSPARRRGSRDSVASLAVRGRRPRAGCARPSRTPARPPWPPMTTGRSRRAACVSSSASSAMLEGGVEVAGHDRQQCAVAQRPRHALGDRRSAGRPRRRRRAPWPPRRAGRA